MLSIRFKYEFQAKTSQCRPMEQLNLDLTGVDNGCRQRHHTTTSFLVSLVFHLVLMLAFSSFWIFARSVNTIRLQACAEQSVELDELSVDLVIPNVVHALELQDLQPPDPEVVQEDPPVMTEAIEYIESGEIDSELVSLDSSELSDPSTTTSTAPGSAGASFFGIPPSGDRIVYILDMSPSMQLGRYQRRFDRAVTELLNSVDQLRPDQQFFVIMFSFKTVKLRLAGNEEFCFPTDENKRKLKRRLYAINLSAGTDPREAIVSALKLKPSCIYLLSDGEFNGVQLRNGVYRDKIDAYQLSLKHNKNKCPIHTIGLEDPRTQEQLTQISRASGGSYVFVPAEY